MHHRDPTDRARSTSFAALIIATILLLGCTASPTKEAPLGASGAASGASGSAVLEVHDIAIAPPNGTPSKEQTLVVHPRDEVTISYLVTNTGTIDGRWNIQLISNGDIVDTHGIQVLAGTDESGKLSWTPQLTGTYTLTLQSSAAGSTEKTHAYSIPYQVKVITPAGISVTGFRPPPSAVAVGSRATFIATVVNNGEETGTKTIDFTVNYVGDVLQTRTISLAGGQKQEVTFEWMCPASGAFSVAVDGASAGIINCFSPAAFDGTITIEAASPQPGSLDSVSIMLHNKGDEAGTAVWEVRFGSTVLGSDRLPIGQGAYVNIDKIKPANITTGAPTDVTLTINGAVVAKKTIAPLLPKIDLYGVGTLLTSHWWGSADCSFSFRLANNGTGRDPNALVTILWNDQPTVFSLTEAGTGRQQDTREPLPTLLPASNVRFDGYYSHCTYGSKLQIRITSPFSGTQDSGVFTFS